MFYDANSFNSDLSGWNTAAVTDMERGISDWDTSNVRLMTNMFNGATSWKFYIIFVVCIYKF